MRFGIIGVGAIAQKAYLPVFKKHKIAKLTCMVDSNESRALSLGKDFNLKYSGSEIKEIFDHVDAVVVSVPNYLHFVVCKKLIKAGKHVLCEKPITISSKECKELITISTKHSITLTAAHVRRFYGAVNEIKNIIKSKELGMISSFNFEEGTIFNWPTVSGYIFNKKEAGGGVLMDIGTHLLDLLFYWIPFEVANVEYEDDNLGGMEAFSKIGMKFSNGLSGQIKLSRLSVLKNKYIINFEKGSLQWSPFLPNKIYIKMKDRREKVLKVEKNNIVKDLIDDFIDSILNGKQTRVNAEDSKKVIKFIEMCYNSRKSFQYEWLS